MMRRDPRSRKSRTSPSSRPRFSFEPLEPRLLLSHNPHHDPGGGGGKGGGGGNEPPPDLVYSTYLGGSLDEDLGDNPIAVDAAGNTYIAGYTASADFPVTPGAFDTTPNGGNDAFVAKFDPAGAIVYATYLGGSGSDRAWSIAVDSLGNAYVAGTTSSNDFPITVGAFDSSLNGADDVFVVKLDPTGTSLVYATFLGGTGDEGANAIALDSAGNAYVAGGTDSTDFPTTIGAFDTSKSSADRDAFVAKLNSTGSSLVYSTYVGGSAFDYARSVAVDTAGHAYLTGPTESTDFPTTPSAFDTSHNGDQGGFSADHRDAFVATLNDTGSALIYSTFLGGRKWDEGLAVAVDATGSAYVTGITSSNNFPTSSGAFDTKYDGRDGFVAKLDAAGSTLVYSTYLGGFGDDGGDAIALDPSGSGIAYVSGRTSSTDFPTTLGAPDTTYNGGSYDAFVTKVNATGSSLLGSTYLGGSDWENGGDGIAVDSSGTVHVIGWTRSTDFPTTPDAFQSTNNGPDDLFLTRLSFDNAAATASAAAVDGALVLPPVLLSAASDSSSADAALPDGVAHQVAPMVSAEDSTPAAQPVQALPAVSSQAELIDRAIDGADIALDEGLLTDLALALIE